MREMALIAFAGGVAPLFSLLSNGSVEAQEYALWSLWQSTDVASRVSIAEARCADVIIATLVAGKLHELATENAAAVLYALASGGVAGVSHELVLQNKQDIVDAGGIGPLIALLRKGSPGAKRSASLAVAQLSLSNVTTAIAITARAFASSTAIAASAASAAALAAAARTAAASLTRWYVRARSAHRLSPVEHN